MPHDRFPVLAPVRFIPANDKIAAKYNTWPFDRGFFQQQIRDYQFKTDYPQKWFIKDRVFIYFDTLASEAIFTLLDEDGVTLATVNLDSSYMVSLAGNTAPDGSTYNSFLYSFKLSDIYAMPVEDYRPTYYFAIECLYAATGSPSNSLYISEPQLYSRDSWPGTILLEYTNLENDYDVLFEQFNYPVMGLRIEGDVQADEMGGHSTTFEDMGYQVSKLQEVPRRSFRLQIGANEGVPAYMHDKVNRIVACDKFSGDGTRYVKDSSAKWDVSSAPDYPLRGAGIQILEYTPDEGATTSTGGVTIILAFPTTGGILDFPCAIPFHSITDGMRTATDPWARSFPSSSYLTDYLAWLNSDFAAYNDLSGHYEVVFNASIHKWVLVYVNGSGEFYAHTGTPWAWNTHIAATITTTAPGSTYDLYTAAWSGGAAKYIVDWGNGVVEFLQTTDVFPTLTLRTGTYAAAGTYNFKIYHCGASLDINEAINFLALQGNANAKITAMPSAINGHQAPTMIEGMTIALNDFGAGAFKTEFLKYCATYLLKLVIQNNNIGSMENDIFGWLSGSPWIINTLSVGNNGLSTAGVSNILFALWSHHTIPPGGIMDLRQTPDHAAAPLTILASTIAGVYTGTYGWTLLHD